MTILSMDSLVMFEISNRPICPYCGCEIGRFDCWVDVAGDRLHAGCEESLMEDEQELDDIFEEGSL